jgi:hypothetical protein
MSDHRELDFEPFAAGYRAGSDGSVWTCKNGRWGIADDWKRLATGEDSSGYPCVRLMCRDKKPRTFRVHVLVLLAFVGPRPQDADGCHINGRRDDPRLENLRWDSRRENVRDALRHGTIGRGGGHHAAKLTDEQADLIRKSTERGVDLARCYGVSEATVSRIRGKRRAGVAA